MITTSNVREDTVLRFFTTPLDLLTVCFTGEELPLHEDSDPASIKVFGELLSNPANTTNIKFATRILDILITNSAFRRRLWQLSYLTEIDSPKRIVERFPDIDPKIADQLKRLTLPDVYNSFLMPEIFMIFALDALSRIDTIPPTSRSDYHFCCCLAAIASIPEFTLDFLKAIILRSNLYLNKRQELVVNIAVSFRNYIMKKMDSNKPSMALSENFALALQWFMVCQKELLLDLKSPDYYEKFDLMINHPDSIFNIAFSHVRGTGQPIKELDKLLNWKHFTVIDVVPERVAQLKGESFIKPKDDTSSPIPRQEFNPVKMPDLLNREDHTEESHSATDQMISNQIDKIFFKNDF